MTTGSKSIALLALASLFSTTNVLATAYFLKSNGNDSAAGTSDATAWRTVSKVNRFAFQPGDDVYFQAGGRWNEQLIVDWSGTDTNRVTIGSYYLSGGKETIGVPVGTQKPALTGNYPIINTTGALPLNPYGGLVHVSADYVTVENLQINNSSGFGLVLDGSRHHAIFQNNTVSKSAGANIHMYARAHDNVVRGNDVSYGAQAFHDHIWLSNSWPGCIGGFQSANNVVEDNYIHACYGEGIIFYAAGSNNNIIRDNLIVWARSAGIYIDRTQNNIVERNIIIGNGGNNNEFARDNGYTGPAISFSIEDGEPGMQQNAVGNVIRNNLIAGTGGCIGMGMMLQSRAAGLKLGGEIIGNTCVGTYTQFEIVPPPANIDTIKIVDNIFYDSVKGAGSCGSPTTPLVTFQNNLWGVLQSDTDCRGSGDVIGNPQLAKASGWRDGGPTNIFKADDFKPVSGSRVLGAGRSISNLPTDFFGATRPTPPAIGAIEAVGGVTTLSTPTGLQLKMTP